MRREDAAGAREEALDIVGRNFREFLGCDVGEIIAGPNVLLAGVGMNATGDELLPLAQNFHSDVGVVNLIDAGFLLPH